MAGIVKFVAIGGGPGFNKDLWLNLEEVKSTKNPNPFILSNDCVFPVESGSVDTVWASHILEHLDTPTVVRVFDEVNRVLDKDGKFVIKMPDFDVVLKNWKDGNSDYFGYKHDKWDYKSVVHTWKNKGVQDCFHTRAAMIFCGFWNSAYGDHYSNKKLNNADSYHGAPIVDVKTLEQLSKKYTPSQISMFLRDIVIKDESDFKFNHQNAWSRVELTILLKNCGFNVKTFDPEFVIKECRHIYDILTMRDISLYCLAKKA